MQMIKDTRHYGLWQAIKDGAKICKYEFLMSRVLLILTCILTILIALLIPFNKEDHPSILATLGTIIYLGFMVFVVSYFLSAAISFYHGIFGRNAYLTHSLPISLDAMIIGKILIFSLWACVFILELIFLDFVTGRIVMQGLIALFEYNFLSAVEAYTFMFALWFSSMLVQLTYIFMIATLVHSKRSYIVVWGIVYYFGISTIFSIVFGIIAAVITYNFWEWLFNGEDMMIKLWCFMVLPCVVLSLVFYFICRVIISKRLSI